MKKRHLVFQAYGNKSILHECAFALLSLHNHHDFAFLNDLQVAIYTDQPAYFESLQSPLSLNFFPLDAATLSRWKGAINFVHRVKVEVLKDYVSRNSGLFLYLDTDTVISENLELMFEKIAAGNLVMHKMEGPVYHSSNRIFKKLAAFLSDFSFPDDFNFSEPDAGLMMWNAGVLGFSSLHAPLLNEVLRFTDLVYPHFPQHIVEQFAFSLYFQKAAPLSTAHHQIQHYWNLKELRPVLDSFFGYFMHADWAKLARYSPGIQLTDYMQQKGNFYQNLNVAGRLIDKQWIAPLPDWDLLIQQL